MAYIGVVGTESGAERENWRAVPIYKHCSALIIKKKKPGIVNYFLLLKHIHIKIKNVNEY